MNILQAHKYYWHRDGASNAMLFLASLLEGEGHSVIPFAMKQKESLESKYSKYFVSEMNLRESEKLSFSKKIGYAGRMIYSREAKKNMKALLRDEKIDVAHLHNIYHHISPSILPVLKKSGVKIVMTLHDYKLLSPNYSLFHHGEIHEEDGQGWYVSCIRNKCMKDSRMQSAVATAEMIFHHKIMRYYERYVDHFIAPSQFMLDTCVRFGWDKRKFSYIPNPIDTSRFKPTKTSGEYVAYIGRLSEEKGVHILLDAAKQNPDIPHKIVGAGPQEVMLRSKVRKEKIDNVEFVGFKTGKELDTFFVQARVLVTPSIWYENNPLSVLEPKAMGKVVIGSDIGGIPELLPRKLLVKPGDSRTLAKKIKTWYDASSLERREMGDLLRRQVEKMNDPEKFVQKVLGVYKK